MLRESTSSSVVTPRACLLVFEPAIGTSFAF
jgi:hypothetical protein